MSNIYYQRPNNSDEKNTDRANDRMEYTGYYHPNYRMPQYNPNNNIVPHTQGYKKDFIANIVLVFLSITLVVVVMALFSELSYINNSYERSASSFWWDYDSGIYVDSVRSRYENLVRGVEETPELTQCYAVAEYFEAASIYKAAAFTGNTDKAQKYLEVMAEAYSKMGDVSYLADDIDTKLGIEEIIN